MMWRNVQGLLAIGEEEEEEEEEDLEEKKRKRAHLPASLGDRPLKATPPSVTQPVQVQAVGCRAAVPGCTGTSRHYGVQGATMCYTLQGLLAI